MLTQRTIRVIHHRGRYSFRTQLRTFSRDIAGRIMSLKSWRSSYRYTQDQLMELEKHMDYSSMKTPFGDSAKCVSISKKLGISLAKTQSFYRRALLRAGMPVPQVEPPKENVTMRARITVNRGQCNPTGPRLKSFSGFRVSRKKASSVTELTAAEVKNESAKGKGNWIYESCSY
jgi:hypothetical protein